MTDKYIDLRNYIKKRPWMNQSDSGKVKSYYM